jgi:hypothetical protein
MINLKDFILEGAIERHIEMFKNILSNPKGKNFNRLAKVLTSYPEVKDWQYHNYDDDKIYLAHMFIDYKSGYGWDDVERNGVRDDSFLIAKGDETKYEIMDRYSKDMEGFKVTRRDGSKGVNYTEESWKDLLGRLSKAYCYRIIKGTDKLVPAGIKVYELPTKYQGLIDYLETLK